MTSELNAYIRKATKQHNPIFHFFLDQFGHDLIDAFNQMDPNSHLDAATQTNMCSKDAAKVVFRDPNLRALDFLDRITAEILFDVGQMLGILFDGIFPLKK